MKSLPPIYLTEQGLAEKHLEKEALDKEREAAVSELTIARDQGDRSENGAYKAARWKLSGIDRRLRELNRILKRAQVITRTNTDIVEPGATATLDIQDKEVTYTFVDSAESDLAKNKLSIYSPIGKAVRGKRAGDTCTAYTPAGAIPITIMAVS